VHRQHIGTLRLAVAYRDRASFEVDRAPGQTAKIAQTQPSEHGGHVPSPTPPLGAHVQQPCDLIIGQWTPDAATILGFV
jgi:hypothetical protein